MEHHHVTHAHDQMTCRSFRQLRREFLFLVLEFRELDFYQLMLRQSDVDRMDEGVTQSRFADLKHRLQMLGARRIWRGNAWYWELKPDLKPGEVFTL